MKIVKNYYRKIILDLILSIGFICFVVFTMPKLSSIKDFVIYLIFLGYLLIKSLVTVFGYGYKKISYWIYGFIVSLTFSTIQQYLCLSIIVNIFNKKSIFSASNIILMLLILLLAFIAVFLKYNAEKKDYRLPIFAIFVGVVSSIILSFVDTKESAIITSITAIILCLLTPDDFQNLISINLSPFRQWQFKNIKFSYYILLSISYFSSRIVQIGENIDFSKRLHFGADRFVIVSVIFPVVMVIFLVLKKTIQYSFLGESDIYRLRGKWQLVLKNKHINQSDLILRNNFLTIDGDKIRYREMILQIDKELNLMNKNEVIGKITNKLEIESKRVDRIDITIKDGESFYLLRTSFIGMSEELKKFSGKETNTINKYINGVVRDPFYKDKISVSFLTQIVNDLSLYKVVNSNSNNYQYIKKECEGTENIRLTQINPLRLAILATPCRVDDLELYCSDEFY